MKTGLPDLTEVILSHIRLMVLDNKYTITETNDKFCESLKYEVSELIGKPVCYLNIMVPDELGLQAVKAQITKGNVWNGKVKIGTKSGEVIWLKTKILPVKAGRRIKAYVILCWDITEEIATLEEKVKSLENLILSENRYRTLIENQTDLISLCDAAGTRVYVNKRYCQFVGKEAHELVGTNILTLTLNGLSTDHIKRVFELTPETPAETNVVRLRNAQGKLVWISFSIKAIFDSDNKLREILTIGRDVSDLKLAEIRLNKYLDDIREIEFMTSHRVRAPIVTMLGLAELLRMNAIHWNDIICNFKGCLSELDQRTKELGEFIYRSLSVRNDQTRRL